MLVVRGFGLRVPAGEVEGGPPAPRPPQAP